MAVTETFPHTLTLADGRVLGIELPPEAVRPARHGSGTRLTPAGARILDRARAAFEEVPAQPTAGHLRSLRDVLGLTQAEMARKIGVTPMTISRWERGQVRPGQTVLPKLRRLRRQAVRQGVALSD